MTTRQSARRKNTEFFSRNQLIQPKEGAQQVFLEDSIQIKLPITKDFPDGTQDIPQPKQRQYQLQEWIKMEEILEYLNVYVYSLLEKGEVFVAYYTKDNENVFKCAEKKCSVRLKIEVNEPKVEEEEKSGHSKAFTSISLKKNL